MTMRSSGLRKHWPVGALLFAMLLGWVLPACPPPVSAQTCTFTGSVTDLLTKKAIVGASVRVGDVGATTDTQGRYRLALPAGTHEVHAAADGYIGMSLARQTVEQDSTRDANFEMVIAAPTAAQRAALDLVFQQSAGPQLSPQELESVRAEGFAASTLAQLPSTIQVLMPDGIVVAMSVDDYVRGVLPKEVPPYWPVEALKAQAVAARCYAATSRRHADVGADVCTTQHCQVWGPVRYQTTDQAVAATHNVVATYAGTIIRAFFHAHCDGHTRNSEDVWQAMLPYLRSVECPCGFTSLYGHGVGMCQQGARALAEQGRSYAQILMHYYRNVQVTSLSSHQLSDARVLPADGDTATEYIFEVRYSGADAPISANLYIDGHTYTMSLVSGAEGPGRLYRYRTLLSAGQHGYSFRFEDGYNTPAVLPTSGTYVGPTVRLRDTELPTPTPVPAPQGTQGWQWTESTRLDFAQGTGQNTEFTEGGDGEVQLAETASSGTYTSMVKPTPMEFVAVGANWLATVPTGTQMTITLRVSSDGQSWSGWHSVPPMDAEREDTFINYGELLYLRGRFLQYRATFATTGLGTSPVLASITLTAIDSRQGPTAQQALAISVAPAGGGPVIISRAAWGANESWMTWAPEYRSVRKFVVHHTATANGDLDPAATVRAIYYYHAVTRGWGDIGYNYLIDAQGRIYEGRKGGEGVVGGHAKQYAWGSIGASLIGNYDEVALPAPAEQALVNLLATKGNLHFVHPTESGFFIDRDLPNIMAHRDGAQTACPGRYAYARLPAVRQAVLTRMAQLSPNVRIDTPLPGTRVNGVLEFSATGSPAVRQVDFYVDGIVQSSDNAAPFSWQWDAGSAIAGQHQLRVQARTAANLRAESAITVTVDRSPPRGDLTAPDFSNSVEVTLETLAQDAEWMVLSNGWHWEGEELQHQTGLSVADPDAWNGKAWKGRGGNDLEGWWYGPYVRNLPTGQSYRAYFRLKTSDNTLSNVVATIDVTDDYGRNTYVSRPLSGRDFAQGLVYQEPYLDFTFSRADANGLEFRTLFSGVGDVYLDRIYLFRAPRAYASSAQWTLPKGDGRKEVGVRYIDTASNVSEVYTATIVLDTQAPEWSGWDGSSIQVRDRLSGLQVQSARYASSGDGGASWGPWQPLAISAAEGTTSAVKILAPAASGTHVRFRLSDRAGNQSESMALAFPVQPATPTLSPTATRTATATATASSTFSPTVTATPSPVPTETPIPTTTHTPSPTVTATETVTPVPTATATATQSPTATATASPSPTPALGSVRGRLTLQGRLRYQGAKVSVSDLAWTITDEEGGYLLPDLVPDHYTVKVELRGYLEAQWEDVAVVASGETSLPDLLLYGGDVNQDCTIDLFDLIIVSSSYGNPQRDSRADIDTDGQVDLRDLVLVARNFGQKCPNPWGP